MHAWFFEDLIPDSIKDALNIQGIPAYGTMIFLAIVVAAVYLILMYKKFGFTQNEIIWMLIYLTVFGLLGAHVFSLLFRVGEIDFRLPKNSGNRYGIYFPPLCTMEE